MLYAQRNWDCSAAAEAAFQLTSAAVEPCPNCTACVGAEAGGAWGQNKGKDTGKGKGNESKGKKGKSKRGYY